jgi:Skp family chaperone for outer membrane proteins
MTYGYSRTFLAALLCAVIGFGTAAQVRAEGADDGSARRIAVVNIARVFNACQKVKDVQDKLVKLFDGERKAMEKDDKTLKDWEDKVKMDPRDPKTNIEFFKEIQRLELARMDFNERMRKLGNEMEDRRKTEMKEVLNLIKTSIRSVGNAEKYDLILRAPEFDEMFERNPAQPDQDANISSAELVRRFRENPVMYYSQGVDITEKVITKVNEEYKTADKLPAPEKAPATNANK